MTFVEELKKISEEASVNRVIKENCAKEGYRTYQVEVIKPFPTTAFGRYGIPENYQIISIHKNHVINDYVSGIYAYLINDLGFKLSDIEKANFQNCRYVSTQITIRW